MITYLNFPETKNPLKPWGILEATVLTIKVNKYNNSFRRGYETGHFTVCPFVHCVLAWQQLLIAVFYFENRFYLEMNRILSCFLQWLPVHLDADRWKWSRHGVWRRCARYEPVVTTPMVDKGAEGKRAPSRGY